MSDTASLLESIVGQISAGFLVVSTIGVSFWKADNLISEDGRKLIYQHITAAVHQPGNSAVAGQARQFLDNYFSRELPLYRFAGNVIVFSLASIFTVLCLYVLRTSGLLIQLTTDALARQQFVLQLLTNGLPVVVVVNYAGASFVQYSLGRQTPHQSQSIGDLLLREAIIKVLLFIALTILIYLIFAIYRGAFVGSPALALRAVRPTLVNALFFQNLTSVYLYSVAISSFPLFVVAFLNAIAARPRFARVVRAALFWLPIKDKPIRAISILFGIALFLFLTVAFSLLSLMAIVI